MSNPSKRAPNRAFWRDGLRFECQGTGKCCTARGEYGYVYFTLEERRRAAALLGMRTCDFTRCYCLSDEDGTYLKNPNQDCLFLEDRRCAIYEARPAQCRTWPFWPENMDPKVWNRDVAGFCEGVGKGPLHTAEEIQALLEVYTKHQG